jgi:hypothetical protein
MNFVYDAPNANFEDDDYENKIEKESKDNSQDESIGGEAEELQNMVNEYLLEEDAKGN